MRLPEIFGAVEIGDTTLRVPFHFLIRPSSLYCSPDQFKGLGKRCQLSVVSEAKSQPKLSISHFSRLICHPVKKDAF